MGMGGSAMALITEALRHEARQSEGLGAAADDVRESLRLLVAT